MHCQCVCECVCVFVSVCVRTEEKSLSVSVISSPSVVLFTPAKIENLSLTIIEGLCRYTPILILYV